MIQRRTCEPVESPPLGIICMTEILTHIWVYFCMILLIKQGINNHTARDFTVSIG